MRITVFGIPRPQGSKRFLGVKGGRGILVESCKETKNWRESVKWAAREAMQYRTGITGPVAVEMIFTMPKPKSAPKTRPTWPDRKPDLSKLIRSTEDALSDAGIWEDDARVIQCTAAKVYPNEGPDALPSPGAVIRIRSVVQG